MVQAKKQLAAGMGRAWVRSCAVAALLAGLPAGAVDFEEDIRPVLQNFCFECHGTERIRGDLNLERFEHMNMVLDSLGTWEGVARRVLAGEMPPRRHELQPTDDERQMLADWIATLQVTETDCNELVSEETMNWYPGFVMSRRLNRAEYENTIRDLFGMEIPLRHLFPTDGAGGEGFDNTGNALYLSAIQMEKYLQAAEIAVEAALPVLDIRGAFTSTPHPLIPVVPSKDLMPREAAARVLEDFLPRAWRRPVEALEVERVLAFFDRAYERGDSYKAALKLAFKAALVSPHFIFLVEPEPPEQGVYELGDFPLASRLSYFLWASMPDAALLEVAGEGRLAESGELRRQVRRMLRDPRAGALGEQFAMQWLGLSQFGELTRPDAERFPEFDDALAADMRNEVVLVFNHIIQEDRSLLELLDNDYTFANARLANLYDMDGVEGEEMQRVELAMDARGGLLGMAGVLTATSHPLRTSPVLRGQWVLEQILGERVPPPPPDAGALPEDDVHPEGLSLREQLEAHRRNPDCASCHESMDPIGFGLENFDPIGRWRDEQAGQPIDSEGILPSGEVFNGPAELKRILLARKDDFARNFTRKLIGYALARPLTRYDDCVINDSLAALQTNDYRPSHLIEAAVLSYPFRHRYSGGVEVEMEY